MKKIYGFAFASAIMALASCSNENEPNIGGNTDPVVEGGNSYLALNISDLSGGTRADDYKIGDDDENAVKSAQFIVLTKWDNDEKKFRSGSDDDAYKVAFVVSPEDMTWTDPGDYPNTVEKIGHPVLVIPSSATGAWDTGTEGEEIANVPNDLEIVVLLNTTLDGINKMSKGDLKKKLIEVNKTGANGTFQMSNSTYLSGTSGVYGQKVSYSYLMKTEDYAKNNPVDVYVERLSARADVSLASSNLQQNNQIYWQNNSGAEKTLTLSVKGLYFFHDPANEYLLKNVEGWSTDFSGFNDATNFRSYWATTPAVEATNQLGLNKISFADAIKDVTTNGNKWDGSDITRYIAENTLGQANVKEATKMVVCGQLMDGDKAAEMVNIMGQFTDLTGAANLVAAQLNGLGYRIYTGTEGTGENEVKKYRTVAGSDLVFSNKAAANTYEEKTVDGKTEFVVAENGQYAVGEGDGNRTYFELATLKSSEKWVKYVQQGEETNPDVPNNPVLGTDNKAQLVELTTTELASLKDDLQNKFQFSYWKDGYCYYYVDINHLPIGTTNTTAVGVVRNHLYDISVNKISGLGTPVFNPEEILIPTGPEYNEKDKVFLSARVNILKWRIVNSNSGIVLGPKN